jgi:hypothetical protein
MVHADGGYTTTINDHGDVEWIPPPHLDTGQARINYHHRPEALLRPPDDPKPLPHNNTSPARTTTDDHPPPMLIRTNPDDDTEHNGDAA